MRTDVFTTAGAVASFLAGHSYSRLADRLTGHVAGEEPDLGSLESPPVAKDLQQLRRKHHVAITLTFSLLDADDHSLAVDIGGTEMESLANAQPSCIAGGQDGLMFLPSHAGEKPDNFFRTENDRQLVCRLGQRQIRFQRPRLSQSDFIEEPQSSYSYRD